MCIRDSIQGVKITASVLKAAIRKFLEMDNRRKQKATQVKMAEKTGRAQELSLIHIYTESKTELTEKEFDAEIEATEDQETVDPETGITLSELSLIHI